MRGYSAATEVPQVGHDVGVYLQVEPVEALTSDACVQAQRVRR